MSTQTMDRTHTACRVRVTRTARSFYEWDAPDGTRWAIRPDHKDNGVRCGWVVMQEDRFGGFVIVRWEGRLRDAREFLANDDMRQRLALNSPARRSP